MTHTIYIVEDETELADLVADYARASGYAPTVFHDGLAALAALRSAQPALVVLDLMLPGIDGLSLCRELRTFSAVPVIMVTARVEEVDRLLGLDIGADDYLCKPFSPRELMARIKAILRRAGPAHEQPVKVDEAARRISVRARTLDLTPSEYAILAAMVRRPGQVFPRAQLLDLARADAIDTTDRAIDTHIKNLRRKLAAVLPGEPAIQSVYGLGYRFEPPP
jgi:two-component system response regulator BaeR